MAGLLSSDSWSYYWPNIFKTEAGYLRALASRMLLPPMNAALRTNWRRMRKDLYRLPPQLRTLPNPYAEIDRAEFRGEFYSLEMALEKPEQVRRLYLRGNSSTNILPAIGRLTKLTILDISGNRLKALPDAICQLHNLTYLHAENNDLIELPAGIGALVNLRQLYLDHNRLTTLPEGIGNLEQLLTFSIGFNQLSILPETIGNLSNLVFLGLHQNRLTSLPETVSKLKKLRVLQLGANPLIRLPQEIGNLTRDLRNLQLTTLPMQPRARPDFRSLEARFLLRRETITARDILYQPNAEVRRIMLQCMGTEKFMREANPEILDTDTDLGGQRRLLRVPMHWDEPLVYLEVMDPSTDRKYLLRVPPTMRTCHQAAAWIAGFDNSADYHPLVET